MQGSNVTNLTSMFTVDVQTQQGTLNSGNSTATKNNSTDFGQYMQSSVEQSVGRQVQSGSGTKLKDSNSQNADKLSESEECTLSEKSEIQESSVKTDNTSEPVTDASVKETTDLNTKTEKTVQIPEELKEVLEEIKNELKQKIMDSFDITEEELEEAMETLAVEIFDLLQTDQLKEFAVYVSGEENLVSMITNAEMYTGYKEVVTCVEEISNSLMEKFSLTPEEMAEIIQQLETISMESGVAEGTVELVDSEVLSVTEMLATATDDVVPEVTEQTAETEKVVLEVANETETLTKEQRSETEVKQVDSLETVSEQTSEQVKNSQQQNFTGTTGENETQDQKMAKQDNDNTNVQTTTTYSTVVGDNEVQTVVQTQRTDFEGIVKQIVEQVKIQIRPDTTSMELQLNPENLGKVNLHISSKEGAVTAQLFVQNEMVKTMIEGQLSVLREAMNQQGVKVEAVEVAVETGDFERNLEQHSEQQKQEAQKQAKSYQHRQINLLAGMDEEAMDEAEILRTHIMRESGNTVDMDA